MQKVQLVSIICFFHLVLLSLLAPGCAQIGAPTGGLKDTIAPSLYKATPELKTVNFDGDKITLQFDEYIDLQNVQNELVVSPLLKRSPQITGGLRNIVVKFRDTLLPNTTYTLDFGNSIKDVNEGNVLKNFIYTFSTGPTIDSLTLTGKVTLAETGMVDSTLQVYLYKNLDDSAIKTQRPDYITKLKGDGNFSFKNLPPANFKIYALKDRDGGKTYNVPTEFFAFAPNNNIVIAGQTEPINLLAYQAKKEEEKKPSTTGGKKDKYIKLMFSPALDKVDLLKPLTITATGDSILWGSPLLTDTLFAPILELGLVHIGANKLELKPRAWEPEKEYRLILDSTFARDTLGNHLAKTDTLKLKVRSVESYGRLMIRIPALLEKVKHPIFQFVQNNVVVRSETGTFDYQATLFEPGEYELRILDDLNNNGVWDKGDYDTKTQPEKVLNIQKKISVKANWDNELTIEL